MKRLVSKRHYLRVFDLIPISFTRIFLAFLTLNRLRASHRVVSVWHVSAMTAAFLVLSSLLTEFHAPLKVPQPIATRAQTLANLCGPVAAEADRIFLFSQSNATHVAATVGISGYGIVAQRANFEPCETPVDTRNRGTRPEVALPTLERA
jgi:hypothetical protein